MTTLRVGGAPVDLDEAKAWTRTYLLEGPRTSACPAYDGYPSSPSDSLKPQDLQSVALLNVSTNPIPVHYGLESLMAPTNERLDDPAIAGDLATADDETLKAIVRLFGALESTPTKYVRLTTLSKVLHRKRPDLLPLVDDNIRYCYSECEGALCRMRTVGVTQTTGERGLTRYRKISRLGSPVGKTSQRWLRGRRYRHFVRWISSAGNWETGGTRLARTAHRHARELSRGPADDSAERAGERRR